MKQTNVMGIVIVIIASALCLSSYAIVITDKASYELGERVTISTDIPDVLELRIISETNIYRYLGDINGTVLFLPGETGSYLVEVTGLNDTQNTTFSVSPKSQTEQKNPVPIQSPNLTLQNLSFNPNWLSVRNRKGETQQFKMSIFDSGKADPYFVEETSAYRPIGRYDLDLRFSSLPVQSIFFRDIDISGLHELRVDDLTQQYENAGTSQFYVIDPTSLNFTNATVTVTAKGETVWKCKEWNYAAQRCDGTWVRFMDVTPGENYTFLLTPEDPAYNESTRPADGCFNERAGTTCTSVQQAAINTSGSGTYPFHKNAGSPIRVSFQNETKLMKTIVNCTVYVNGYDNQANTWTLQTGNWSTATWDSAGTGKLAPNPQGTLAWDCTSHFGTQNDTTLFNDFAVRISTNDGGTPATAYIDYVYVYINFTVPDTQNPSYYNITARPSEAVFYNSTRTYQFNTTWIDNEAMQTVTIEHNFTGTLNNYSITGSASSNYYYNYPSIPAGSYVWRMKANDTSGNNNTTPWQSYNVSRATSILQLLLNGTAANFTVNNSGTVNITVNTILGEGQIYVYRNGTLIMNGTGSIQNISLYNATGYYNITAFHNITQNYTASYQTWFIIVKDTIPPGPVTGLNETATSTSWIFWNWTNPTDVDFDHVEVWLGGVFKTNTSAAFYNATGLLASTTYEIQTRTVDKSGNQGVFTNDSANTTASADTTPPAITNVNATNITDKSAIIRWNTSEPSTSIVKYGTSSGVYAFNVSSVTLVTGHALSLTGLTASTTYYYVVNSSDGAGNSNQSSEYNFTTQIDQTPPAYANVSASPQSPVNYSPGRTYQFNTTWLDPGSLAYVWIEHNFNGTMRNYSVNGNASNIYYYTYTSIPAGTYNWRVHANDTQGNSNVTIYQEYTVNKADPNISLKINGSATNYTVNESVLINISGYVSNGEGNISISIDGVKINEGRPGLENITSFGFPGIRNITLEYATTQNYSYSNVTLQVNVTDNVYPTVYLTDPPDNSTDPDGNVIFTFTVNDTSTIDSCSLYINGSLNQTKPILTLGLNTFTIDNIKNGNYSWNVSCTDPAGHTNTSQTWNIRIYINEFYPHLYPVTCSDANGCTPSNINNTPGTWEEHGALSKSPRDNYVYVNFSNTTIPAGSTIHWMYIYYDKYQATLEGFSRLEWLNGTQWVEICSQIFLNATVQAHDYLNCTWSNATRPSFEQIAAGLQIRMNFYYSGNPAGVLYGTDETYINLKYTEDTTPPVVELVSPDSYMPVGQVDFRYIPSDLNLYNCTLYGNFNGSWAANKTDPSPIKDTTNQLSVNLTEGYYFWNVYCCDVANNCAYDTLGGVGNGGNYSVNITNPDYVPLAIEMNMSTADAKEGDNVTLNATFTNIGNVNGTDDITVQFFLGDPQANGTQIGQNQTIAGLNVLENKTVSVSWIIPRGGPLNVYVVIDPPTQTGGLLVETNENNNKLNQTFNIGAYHYFYGLAKTNIYLANSDNLSLYYYLDITNVTGNVFATNDASTLSFGALQALARNTTNGTASQDFSEADTALNMTGYADSITNIYGGGSQTPLQTQSFTTYQMTINTVPVANSTNTTEFLTGILWDTNDGGIEYTGTQDLAFITKIGNEKQGAYGIYDYEIRIPSNLKKYNGAGTKVALYWELSNATS